MVALRNYAFSNHVSCNVSYDQVSYYRGEQLSEAELREYNKEAADIWNREVLVRCGNCAR